MAKEKDFNFTTGDKMPRSPGDSPFYDTKAGFCHPVTGLSNDLTGVPPAPAMRGDTHSVGSVPIGKGSAPRDNGVVASFFQSKERN